MTDQLQDVYLSGNSLDVAHILNLLFFEDLDSHFLAGQVVISELDLSEGALAYGLAKNIVADVFELSL
jgi:hypothetical protein